MTACSAFYRGCSAWLSCLHTALWWRSASPLGHWAVLVYCASLPCLCTSSLEAQGYEGRMRGEVKEEKDELVAVECFRFFLLCFFWAHPLCNHEALLRTISHSVSKEWHHTAFSPAEPLLFLENAADCWWLNLSTASKPLSWLLCFYSHTHKAALLARS